MYSGYDIFKLVDTHGLPLDIVNLMLREKGESFNTPEFIIAALKGKWTPKRIELTLIASAKPDTDIEALRKRIIETIENEQQNHI